MPEADVAVDAISFRRLANISADRFAVGDRGIRLPGTERIAEREHVRIGANAGIAEQVPGAADGVAAFEDNVGFVPAAGLHMIGGVDAGKPAADDDDVKMFLRHGSAISMFDRTANFLR
jgi:hypothetical protein